MSISAAASRDWLAGRAFAQSTPPAPEQATPEQAARQGAEAYERGDYAAALQWYRKAAEQGYAPAQFVLGGIYFKGRSGSPDIGQAVMWWRKAADQGWEPAQKLLNNKDVQSELGRMYSEGEGVARDDVQAVVWLRKAAEQGDVNAQLNLGTMFKTGRGVRRNYAEAIAWFRKAADQGYAPAQMKIGFMYFNGIGVAPDRATGFAWLLKAANNGDAIAQLLVGTTFLAGTGVPKDTVLAKDWLLKSARQGNDDAKAKLAELGEDSRAWGQDNPATTPSAQASDRSKPSAAPRAAPPAPPLQKEAQVNANPDMIFSCADRTLDGTPVDTTIFVYRGLQKVKVQEPRSTLEYAEGAVGKIVKRSTLLIAALVGNARQHVEIGEKEVRYSATFVATNMTTRGTINLRNGLWIIDDDAPRRCTHLPQ